MNPSQPPQGSNIPTSASQTQQSHNPYQSPTEPNPFPQQPQQPFNPHAQQPAASGLAITSMVLGIISIFSCFFGIIVGGIAVIFGHIAINKINRDPQTIGGKGMAIAGLSTGYVGIALAILFLIGAQQEGPEGSAYDIFQESFKEEMQRELERQNKEQSSSE